MQVSLKECLVLQLKSKFLGSFYEWDLSARLFTASDF